MRRTAGRTRDYPEPVYLAFELIKPIFGSARRTERRLGDPEIWKRFLRALIRAGPGDQRLKDLLSPDQKPIRAYHYRCAAHVMKPLHTRRMMVDRNTGGVIESRATPTPTTSRSALASGGTA
jgi:hypothetical protein